jgi:hypothetical protein
MLEILKLILSDISKIFYGENYVWGNERSRTHMSLKSILTIVDLVIWTELPKVNPGTVSFSLEVWIQAEVPWLPPCL